MARHNPDRLLVRDGFRHFRRTYSMREVQLGLLVFVCLIAIAAWIAWRGTKRPAELYGAVELSGGSGGEETSGATGILPSPLLDDSWTERERSEFDTENLYEKINGRARLLHGQRIRAAIFRLAGVERRASAVARSRALRHGLAIGSALGVHGRAERGRCGRRDQLESVLRVAKRDVFGQGSSLRSGRGRRRIASDQKCPRVAADRPRESSRGQ